MSIVLGMPTLIELGIIENQIQFAKSLDLNFIELNLDLPYFQTEELSSVKLKELSEKNNIFFTLHLPENLDFGCFQTEIRNGNLAYLQKIIIWAAEAEIKTIVMHLNNGIHFSLPEQKVQLYEEYSKEYLTNIVDSLTVISNMANAHNIIICIENTGNFKLKYIELALKTILKYDNIYLTRDVGHEIRSSGHDTPLLEKYQHKIKHLHLHMAICKTDHLPIIEQNEQISYSLEFAKIRNCSVVIEVKTKEDLKRSVEFLKC